MSSILAPFGHAWPRFTRYVEPMLSADTLNFWAGQIHPLWSFNQPLVQVVAREISAHHTVTLTLKPNRHVPSFQAGQHIGVIVPIAGVLTQRSYSPSRVPHQPDQWSITVKQQPNGRVSRYLCAQVQVGDVLAVSPAFGQMTLPKTPQALLLLAAGSGITPMISLIRAAIEQGVLTQPIRLMYWVRHREDACFVQELRTLAARNPQLTVRFYWTASPALYADERTGRLDAHLLHEELDQTDLLTCCAYACGPAGFVAQAQSLLAKRVGMWHHEAFSLPALAMDDSHAKPARTVQVTLSKQGRTVVVSTQQPLLAALEAAGIQPAYGCRMGICNTCACGKTQGITQDRSTQHTHDQPTRALKLCISHARSDLTLDL